MFPGAFPTERPIARVPGLESTPKLPQETLSCGIDETSCLTSEALPKAESVTEERAENLGATGIAQVGESSVCC